MRDHFSPFKGFVHIDFLKIASWEPIINGTEVDLNEFLFNYLNVFVKKTELYIQNTLEINEK